MPHPRILRFAVTSALAVAPLSSSGCGSNQEREQDRVNVVPEEVDEPEPIRTANPGPEEEVVEPTANPAPQPQE